jgi:hypothetical protein
MSSVMNNHASLKLVEKTKKQALEGDIAAMKLLLKGCFPAQNPVNIPLVPPY